MPVYVDNYYKYTASHFGRIRMSHMFADSEEELDTMAEKLKLKPKWKQGKGPVAYFDIGMSKRQDAIAYGAKEVTCQEMVKIRKRIREKHVKHNV